jgi:cytochrome c556
MTVILGFALSVAAMTATEAIKEREKMMEGIRDEMKTLGAIAKKEQPFDAEVVHASAATIAENLKRSAELFPEGSDKGDVDTEAKAEIWTNRDQFDELLAAAHQAAVDMQSVSSAEEFPPALGKLGNGCKSCHDLFRQPKQ